MVAIAGLRRRDFVPGDGGRGGGASSGVRTAAGQELAELPVPSASLEPYLAYSRAPRRQFGRLAVDMGLLSPAQVQHLLHLQPQRGGKLGDLALAEGLLTAEQVREVLEGQTFVVHVDARRRGDPAFLTWVADIKRAGLAPKICEVSAEELSELRQAHEGETELDLETLNQARRLFEDAAAMNSSDIHVLVRGRHAEVQLRVLGDLRTVTSLSMRQEEGEALIRSTFAGLAKVKDTYNHHVFQDGQIAGETFLGSGVTSVRLVRGPAYPAEAGGGFMVARLQYGKAGGVKTAGGREVKTRQPTRPGGELELARMGWTPRQIEMAEELVRLPMGIVIVTGPTGSGKTTSMHELMKHQARLFPGARQITVEDPPEYPMPWAIQLTAKGERFPEIVRETLRMDPDILLFGELRGAAEAKAAMHAALTGHFVWTTTHVRDAFKTINRLEQLGVPRAESCDHEQIVGMVAQRLVSVLCPKCSKPLSGATDEVPAFITERLRTWGDLSAVRVTGDGCDACRGLGTVGKRAVVEVVVTDEDFMQTFLEKGVLVARRNHRMKPGSDKSMLANGIDLVLQGLVDPLTAHRGVHQIEHKEDGV